MTSRPVVLVVDDEPTNRKLLAALVTSEGFDVVVAASGAEALAAMSTMPVDLVLLDLVMPGVSGKDVLAELRRSGLLPALPVVVISAHEARDVRIEALTMGAVDFIVKPLDTTEVSCKIRTLVELRRLRVKAEEQVRRAAKIELYDWLQRAMQDLPLYLYRGRITEAGMFKTDWVMGNVMELTNQPIDEYLARPNWLERVHASDREQVVNLLGSIRTAETNSWRISYRIDHPTRGEVPVLNVGNVDRSTGVVTGAALDVTVERVLEERLAQASKMEALGQLAGGIAHDFNNILSVIMGFTTFAREELSFDDERRADLGEVLKASQRAVGLTRQLLAFSRRQPSAKRATNLNERLIELQRLLGTSIGEHVSLVVRTAPLPAVVQIDPIQFDQLLLNLAINARDAMPDGGRLLVAVDHVLVANVPDGHLVRLTVMDSGIGMDEQTKLRIFEPFFTTKGLGKGTGLGLATCFAIIQEAGGTVRVDSAVGRGTTFVIDLPASDTAVDAPVEQSVPRVGHGESVLVVEDEPALRRALARTLENAGYDVLTAVDGQDAIRMIDRAGSRFDVILTDVVMPNRSGYDVAVHAAAVAPNAAVILTSGYVDEVAQRHQTYELPLLWKPVPHEELLRAISDALAHRTARQHPTPARAEVVVLIVEADEMLRRAYARLLNNAGYKTGTATTLEDVGAFLAATTDRVVVLTDVSVSDTLGTELVEWIQRERSNLLAHVVALNADDSIARWATDCGCGRILTKPVESVVLLGAIDSLAT